MPVPRFQLVPGGRLVHRPEDDGVGWRLLGPNNRELGRSTLSYADEAAALEAVAKVRRGASTCGATIRFEAGSLCWSWQLEDEDGVVVAASGRGFRLEAACRRNLEQFRSCAATALGARG
jgi:hypothetical protein